jgi:hypothetical protein
MIISPDLFLLTKWDIGWDFLTHLGLLVLIQIMFLIPLLLIQTDLTMFLVMLLAQVMAA